MIINTERSLAHIEKIEWIKPIPNADNIELVGILGWQCIAKIGEFNIGDKAIYIEIDSLVPSNDDRFKFLESKKYRIKTMKLGKKFGSPISQGLAMPITLFSGFEDLPIGADVTRALGIKYYVPEDNERKSNKIDPEAKYKRMKSRHPKFFSHPLVKKMMKKKFFKEFFFVILGKETDKPKAFPAWVSKTDETRCENIFHAINFDIPYVVTEKIDGTSSTFTMRRLHQSLWDKICKIQRFDYAVCSRNVRQLDRDQETYFESAINVYWEMSDKYDIKTILSQFLRDHPKCQTVTIQGEIYGQGIQGNPYKLDYKDLAVFNFVIDGVRLSTPNMESYCVYYGLPTVPILERNHYLPRTMEELKAEAEGKSVFNPKIDREGLVYRNSDAGISFKNVSNTYLLKHSD